MGTKKDAPTVRDVWDTYFHDQGSLSLSWRLIYEMLPGWFGTDNGDMLRLIRGAAQDDETRRLAPRYVMTVRVEVGVNPERNQ
jgi:hypothetical protein